jgi:penicillin amidase
MTSTTPDPEPAPEPARVTGSAWRGFRGLPRALRWTSYVATLVALLLVAGLVTVTVMVRRPLPSYDGEIELPGLGAEVTVLRDEFGIPQIYAETTEDLMRAQGFVHAQERFYEMDVRRHATAGRLSELFGETALESDTFVRTMDWRGVAERELALVRPETRAALEAYAAGVNAYLEGRGPSRISVAYTILNATGLGYRPEPWTPVDSLAWLKAMAWDLRGNMQDEISRALTLAAVGGDRTAELYPGYDAQARLPIVTGGEVVDGEFEPEAVDGGTREPTRPAWGELAPTLDALSTSLRRLPTFLGRSGGRGDGLGSNSWVVGPELSATGSPILANDPHLGIGVPGIWVPIGLHCVTVSPDCAFDVSGFSFSGVPGVIIGHNADIAWGLTNLGPDVTDLFVERIRGDAWFRDGAWEPLRTRTETIEVAGGDDVTITVRSTLHGPLLSDASEDLRDVADQAPVTRSGDPADEYALALQWTALTPGRTADAILAIDVAGDWDDFRAAAATFEVPAQNLIYADTQGRIAYQAPGRIPIRKSGNSGLLPSAGWLPENDWTGDFVPYEGFIVTANQAVIDDDYPFYLTADWDQGFRSQRIRERLTGQDSWSVEQMTDLQAESRHPLAADLVPYLLEATFLRSYYRDGQALLLDWDFSQDAGSPAAAYFNAVWRNLLEITFHDELPEEAWPDGGDRWVAATVGLLEDPDNPWWDDVETDDVIETRDDVLRLALIGARDELTARQAVRSEEWNWGFLHELELREATFGSSGIPPLEWLFNRDGWEVGGGTAAVDATGWDAAGIDNPDHPYRVTTAPSMRMVVDLGDLDASRWINLTGVSGHPFSPHYTDQTDLWARGETLPWAFTRQAVDATAEHELRLVP